MVAVADTAHSRLTVWHDLAIGEGRKHEAKDGQDNERHGQFEDQDEEDEGGVLVEAHGSNPQQPGTQIDLILPAGRSARSLIDRR